MVIRQELNDAHTVRLSLTQKYYNIFWVKLGIQYEDPKTTVKPPD
jgi:hypothetical protein